MVKKYKNNYVVTIFQTCVIYFQYTEILSELKRLASVNLNGTYLGEFSTRPLSCTATQTKLPTIYIGLKE